VTHQNDQQGKEVQIPIGVMKELLTELRAANEKVERIVSLAQSVQALEAALNHLTSKVMGISETLYHSKESGGIFTRLTLLEQRVRQSEDGWQRWITVFGSICGALALILSAFIRAGI
jgi:hypothetical protein